MRNRLLTREVLFDRKQADGGQEMVMFHKLKEFIQPDKRPPRECEACGKPFICGASLKGCWCVQLKLDAVTRQRLRERYKDCLCSDCLKRFAEAPESTG